MEKLAGEWKAKPSLLQQAYQYNFFYLIAQQYYQQSSALHDFDLEKHEALLKTLSHEYQNVQVSVRQTIANIHHAHVTELKYEEAYGHFEALFNQGDEALSCASVLNQHTETLQQILPVFLMTPTSLAVTLKDSPAKFDLVIIDSASQLTISQSLHAILRGSQVILVGDTARLSPLELNLKSQIASDPKWDHDGITQESSVFADFVQAGFPVCHLTTHYTSRHQQLFQFSNQKFYQNNIHLFATPELNQKGMILTHVPEGIFDPDTAYANLEEAKQVADAVIKHAKAHPEQSLAVLTMSDSQKEAILHQVELQRKINPDAESFFNEKQENEAFVVAKMNEFYADLRDTVFISFGFGKNIDEQLPTQFGALSKPAGEKWLNTALNRARTQTRIFSSLHAADVLVQESSPAGVVCFNALLEFLENGMAAKKESIEPASIPFENEVIHQINSLGYAVDFAVGSGAQKVVFAVKSNVTTQAYALGIECDTSPFPPRQTVDEKVAIRDATLHQLGWRLHKVWSAQWFQTPEAEMARLHQAILSAEARFEQLESQLPADAQPLKLLTEQYQTCALRELSLKQGDKLCSISTPTLVNEISKIIEVESPIHIKQLALRLFSAVTLQGQTKRKHTMQYLRQ